MAKKIGDTLKESRINAGISVEQISELLTKKGYKASIKTIYSWESGNSSPGPDALLEMCDIYKIDNILNTFGYNGYKDDGSIQLNIKEIEHIEKYRSLDDYGRKTIDMIMEREIVRVGAIHKSAEKIKALEEQAATQRTVTRYFSYYGKIAAAGKSFGFDDIIAADLMELPVTDLNKDADYLIGVSGDSMEPTYFDGDIVYVKKTTHLRVGDVGIFQKDNGIYIKEVGEDGLISHNSQYRPMINGGNVLCLGKVIGRVGEDE